MGKYSRTIELQDQGMCNKCDDKTSLIADEITKKESKLEHLRNLPKKTVDAISRIRLLIRNFKK